MAEKETGGSQTRKMGLRQRSYVDVLLNLGGVGVGERLMEFRIETEQFSLPTVYVMCPSLHFQAIRILRRRVKG